MAWKLGYQPQLGHPWFELISGVPIYVPPSFFWWWYAYDAYAPRVFVEGAYIASSGGFISIAVAVSMSVWRAREAKTAATYGSARWATLTEIRAAGLTAPDGVVLGGFGRDYLRHDGPEHVLCFAPTRSGEGVGLAVPTLLTWPGSCIVHDIKGENWTLTSGFEIGMPEISFGAYPQFSGPGAQMQLTSKRATWLVLTAERIDGRTAQDWGMVNSSVPASNSRRPHSVSPPKSLNSKGVISAAFLKDATDPHWNEDPGLARYRDVLSKYVPDANRSDALFATGYTAAQAVELVLRRCGNNLTRDNVMKQAANFKHVSFDLFLSGIEVNTSSSDFTAVKDMNLMRFDEDSWRLFGGLVRAPASE